MRINISSFKRGINLFAKKCNLSFPIKLLTQIWKQFIGHRCLQQAAALAFSTILSLVPLLAVAFFLLNAFGDFQNANSDIIAYIRDNFLPQYEAQEIVDAISKFAKHVDIGKWGLIAFFPLLLISMLLFNAIESIFNDIWEVKASRHIFYKFAAFYVIITTGPIFVALSIYQAEKLQWMAGQNGSFLLPWMLGHLIPFFFMWLALVLAYKLLPNTTVRWQAVLIGAFVASIMIEATRMGFGYYLSNFVGTGYAKLYGSIAFVPILAVWIYMSWLIILFGTEFAHVYQNIKKLHLKEAIQGEKPTVGNGKIIFVNSILAIKLFLAVADNFCQHGDAIPKSDISLKFGIPEDIVDRIFKYYRESNLIWEVEGDTEGYIPARPLEEIYLNQVVDAFEGKLEELVSYGETFEPLQMLSYQLTAARHDIINGISVLSLISPKERKRIESGIGMPVLLEDKSQNHIDEK